MLLPGGFLAFSDWIALPGLGTDERAQLAHGIAARDIASLEQYRDLLAR